MPAVVRVKQSDIDAAYRTLYKAGLADEANMLKARIALLEVQAQQLGLESDGFVALREVTQIALLANRTQTVSRECERCRWYAKALRRIVEIGEAAL